MHDNEQFDSRWNIIVSSDQQQETITLLKRLYSGISGDLFNRVRYTFFLAALAARVDWQGVMPCSVYSESHTKFFLVHVKNSRGFWHDNMIHWIYPHEHQLISANMIRT